MGKDQGKQWAGATKTSATAPRISVQAARKTGRKSAGAPDQVQRDARTVRLLNDTLKRAKPSFAPSLRSQLSHLVRQALKARRAGRDTFSEPMKSVADAAGCEVRQARVNMRTLENWGAIIRLANGGGAVSATWRLDGEILFRALVSAGCNPHPDLRNALRVPETFAANCGGSAGG